MGFNVTTVIIGILIYSLWSSNDVQPVIIIMLGSAMVPVEDECLQLDHGAHIEHNWRVHELLPPGAGPTDTRKYVMHVHKFS